MQTTTQHELECATPESQGIASSAILQFVEAAEKQLHDIHSFMLLRHGKVVAEGWWSPYGRDYPHMMFSVSKSFTSTAIGLAVDEGLLSVDDTVLSFFPEDAPTKISRHLGAMRVRHLLSMSTGHDQDTMDNLRQSPDGNWTKTFFEIPVNHQPGTHFLYNTGASYMLSAIVQKVTGMKLIDYLEPRLFAPLGIKNAWWEESPQGINMGGFGLSIKTEDLARLGQLYLQKGLWNNQRILSEAWVAEATAYHSDNSKNDLIDWQQGYGYQFWRCQNNAYRGDGAFGQYCVVMSDQDAVLAITSGLQGMQKPLDLVWDILLPAMQGDALPENKAAQKTLTKKLSSLSVPPVEGEASSPTAAKVSGHRYVLEANEMNLKAVTLDFNDANCIATFNIGRVEEKITCGYGVWQKNHTTLFNQVLSRELAANVTSGAWTASDTFTLVVRFYESPFYQTFVFHFVDDGVTIETRVNVAFGPIETLKIAGRSQ